jgi:hypothetical protein
MREKLRAGTLKKARDAFLKKSEAKKLLLPVGGAGTALGLFE